jgi:hypothetical protein
MIAYPPKAVSARGSTTCMDKTFFEPTVVMLFFIATLIGSQKDITFSWQTTNEDASLLHAIAVTGQCLISYQCQKDTKGNKMHDLPVLK